MKKLAWAVAVISAGAGMVLLAQQSDISATVSKQGAKPRIAVPDFRGADVAPGLMSTFNQTLWSDLESSGTLTLVAKTMYPRSIPQQPSDLRQPPPAPVMERGRKGITVPQSGGGLWMTDWSSPPVSANYLAFGYTAMQNGVLVLYGNLFDASRPDPSPASQPISKRYLAPTADENGARDVAHQFAADILKLFGAQSMFGTHIYYVHQDSFRSPKEIWMMDPDGKNQRQFTHFNNTTIEPSVSPDGTKIAFTSYTHVNPGIFVFSVNPVRDLRFYNQVASMNGQPSFTADGKQIVYSSSAGGHCCRIFVANLDGRGFRSLTSSQFIDTEPKVNPKTSATVLFSSGRSGHEQIYMMSIEGADIQRMTDGSGEASNPNWNPTGDSFAFAWTRGYQAGKFNVFVMDPGSHRYVQLTHDEGRNENPSWAPDGTHLAFMSNRTGSSQIWTMLADGTQLQRLTSGGLNFSPAWGK
jgi:TolB protein